MQGYCARCGQKSDGRLLCQKCGSQLAEDGSTIPTMPLPVDGVDESLDNPSFLRRLTLGGITLIGLFQGLKHLALAVALNSFSSGSFGAGILVVLLVTATLAASAVAGTVNRRAELTGFLLGYGAAVGYISVDLAAGPMPAMDWLIGIPILLAVAGALGGLAGKRLIPPSPLLPRFGQFESRLLNKAVVPPVPVVWWRIILGALLVIVGTEYAEPVRQRLAHVLAGKDSASGSIGLLTWQVSVVFALLGGVVSGAGTGAGIRQGLLAGLAAGAGVLIAESVRNDAGSLLLQFWSDQLGLGQSPTTTLAALGCSVFVVTAVGGWLGAHLFPPPRRRGSTGSARPIN